MLYRRGPDEIPARKDELWGAIEEGIEFVYNVQPVGVHEARTAASRCAACGRSSASRARTGAAWPIEVPGSEHDYDCGLVILATGQKAESAHLDELGLMAAEKVRTDWDSMRTEDPKVFAAGDGAFGPSTIVNAMYHGHRAAYYVKAFLEGIDEPLPYRTPYKTRRVPIAAGRALGGVRARAPGLPRPGREPGRVPGDRVRLHGGGGEARGGTLLPLRRRDRLVGLQRPHARGHLRHGAHDARRTHASSARSSRSGSRSRQAKHFHPEVASLDDIVFLPANLSRLVIDPYRDACRVATELGGGASSSPRRSWSPASTTRPRRYAGPSRTASRRAGSPTSAGARSATACPGCSCSATRTSRTRRRPP